MIEILIAGIIGYALFKIFYYLLKIPQDFTGWTTPHIWVPSSTDSVTFTLNNNFMGTINGTIGYWNSPTNTASQTLTTN